MLLDWVTCRVPLDLCSDEVRTAAQLLGDRIARYNPKHGIQSGLIHIKFRFAVPPTYGYKAVQHELWAMAALSSALALLTP